MLDGLRWIESVRDILPDGAGVPASYTVLPTLHPSFRVLGLSSPIMTNQATYNLSLIEVTIIFFNTIMHAVPTAL